MKTPLLLLLLTLNYGYSQVIWDRDYLDSNCEKIIELDKENYFVISSFNFLKISSNGDTVFTNKRLLPDKMGPTRFRTCAHLGNGYIAVGSDVWYNQSSSMYIIESNGHIMYSRIFKRTKITDLIAFKGGIVIALEGAFNGIIRYSPGLDSMWAWRKSDAGNILKLYMNNNSNIVGISSTGKFLELDSNGRQVILKNTIKRTDLLEYYTNLNVPFHQHGDFYYLMLPKNELLKISLSGDSISSKSLFTNDSYTSASDFVPDNEGFSFLYPTYYASVWCTWNLVRTNIDYEVIDKTRFDVRQGYLTNSRLLKDSQGNYLFGGNASENFSYGTNMRILKYRINQNNTSTIKSENDKLSIYPNPAKEFLNIQSRRVFQYFDFEIYNSIGNLVASGDVPKNGTLTRESLGIKEGIYFIKLFSERNFITSSKIEFY